MKKALIIVKGLEDLACELAAILLKADIHPEILTNDISSQQKYKSLSGHFIDFDILNAKAIEDFNYTDVDYIFIIVGNFLEKNIKEVADDEIQFLYHLHFLHPVKILRKIYQQQSSAAHLIIVGSCSAWRLQKEQSIYTALRSAQATFTRNLAVELMKDKPGSKVSLINLAGMKIPEINGKTFGADADFMDPQIVAALIREKVISQTSGFHEMNIMRRKPVTAGSSPNVIVGPCMPEIAEN